MNYRPILLVGSGVIIGAATLGAMNVSAQQADEDVEWKGRHGLHGMDEGHMHMREMHHHQFAEELLGLSADELKAELDTGKTFEEVVLANGYDSIESFREAVESKVREDLAEKGFSEEEINQKIELRKQRMMNRLEHLSENFDESEFRERLEDRGLSDDEIDSRLERIQQRIESFNEQ